MLVIIKKNPGRKSDYLKLEIVGSLYGHGAKNECRLESTHRTCNFKKKNTHTHTLKDADTVIPQLPSKGHGYSSLLVSALAKTKLKTKR
jgi:hypothetical protein